jgi:hypothetical protein
MKRIAILDHYPIRGFQPEDFASVDDFRRAMGGNPGNVLFKTGAVLTACRDLGLVDAIQLTKENAARISEDYHYVLLSAANLINPYDQKRDFSLLTAGIERLKIPLIVLSIGAQNPMGGHAAYPSAGNPSIRRWLSVVADHCEVIGARGAFTAEVLNSLGIKNVLTTGCPSIYSKGAALLDYHYEVGHGPIAVNYTPWNTREHRQLADRLLREALSYGHYLIEQDPRFVPQLLHFMDTLSCRDWTVFSGQLARAYGVGRLRFFSSYWPWVQFLSGFSFAVGTRIHGNIAALLAGVPAHVIAHDTRTQELAAQLGIPWSPMSSYLGRKSKLLIPDIIKETDMSGFRGGFLNRLEEYICLLEKNGVQHNFSPERRLSVDHHAAYARQAPSEEPRALPRKIPHRFQSCRIRADAYLVMRRASYAACRFLASGKG